MRFGCDFVWVVSCVFEVFLYCFDAYLTAISAAFLKYFEVVLRGIFIACCDAFSNAFLKYFQLDVLHFVYVLCCGGAFYCAILMIFLMRFIYFEYAISGG
jgi:hypothetical protein